MWGYYANGFKGVAIEIEIDETDQLKVSRSRGIPIKIEIDGGLIHKMRYSKDVARWVINAKQQDHDEMVLRVLTTKLMSWRIEDEYRFVCEADQDGLMPIGKITAVHVGWAHKNVKNEEDIKTYSSSLRKYWIRAKKFMEEARRLRIPCLAARPCGNSVVSEPW